MPIEDEHITAFIAGCIQEDRKAQEKLYRAYYKVMMNLCLRYTHNEQDALAILNIGFFKVFKNIRSFDNAKASIYTWIRMIVIHACLDHIKSSKSRVNAGELSDAGDVIIEPSVIASLHEGALLAMIRQLSPASQAVFNLFVMEGYGHKEIAAMLNISEGTSKWHLNDSRKKIKKLIEQSAIRH